MKYLPQKILAVLFVFLMFLLGFTYYLQKPIPTFKRLVSEDIVLDLQNIKLNRYDTKHHPVVFRLVAKDGKSKKVFANLVAKCKVEKISSNQVPDFIDKVDKDFVKTIKKSKQIFSSKLDSSKYYLIFTQNEEIFLYTNDKF